MKIHQLRYVHEVAKNKLNISAAAEVLHTSQPGVSKQIQLLEDELGLQIFQRNGKRLVGVTEPGEIVINLAQRILREMESIMRVGEEFANVQTGSLTIATTHTQARYKLPAAVKAFIEMHPNIKLNIHQGNPTQVAEQIVSGEADVGIATESISHFDEILCLPCYQWNRCVVVPHGHPLIAETGLTLANIAHYPIVTYDYAFTGATLVSRVFHEAGIEPNVVLTAIDADVIKTYVSLGMGIGLIAQMAYDPARDGNLVMLDVSHLFPASTTFIGVRKDAFLRSYMVDFMQLLAPSHSRKDIQRALML
ncbi:MAG: CysB family HTH-type transcriptional regulator [Methylophilaceae bacterium]